MARGASAHSSRLKALSGPTATRLVGRALFAAGNEVQVEAQLSITRGAVSGKGHVASKPGEAPNADTHFLADQIETVQTGPLVVEVTSKAPYSAALEFGTSKMAERPFMRPAVAKKRARVVEIVTGAMKRATGG